MRGLSLLQPWSTLIAAGEKHVETRSWGVAYRGLVAIHASARWSVDDREIARHPVFAAALDRAGFRRPTPRADYHLPMGSVLAVATLGHVGKIYRGSDGQVYIDGWPNPITGNELEFGNYQPGRYGWAFTFIRPLITPVPCRGNRGLWNVPQEIVDRMGLVGVE